MAGRNCDKKIKKFFSDLDGGGLKSTYLLFESLYEIFFIVNPVNNNY